MFEIENRLIENEHQAIARVHAIYVSKLESWLVTPEQ